MEQSLSAGNNMEFFIEGSRSRSGKPNSPKAGLLSVLVDSVQEGEPEAVLCVFIFVADDLCCNNIRLYSQFVFLIFVPCANNENYLTTKISRSTVGINKFLCHLLVGRCIISVT